MTLPLIILWVLVISAFSVLGAWYARRYNRPDALIAFYVTLVLFANIATTKIIVFDFGSAQFFATATTLFFAVTYLLTDIVNEKFGKKETKRMIMIAVFSQIAVILFTYIVLKAQGAPFFENQDAFEAVLGSTPRIIIASLITFYIMENLDAHLFHWFKKLTSGKHLWMRNAFSTLPATFLDSILFVTLAFYGVLPIVPIIIGLIVVKWFVGILDIPFMYLSRAILGKREDDNSIQAAAR